jgi:protein O-GlcNAc transferase
MSARPDIAARFAEGVAARAAWQLDTAAAIFRGLCSDPHARPRALTELAVSLALEGRGDEALACIAEAVRLAPMDSIIRQNALILEKLREPADPQHFVDLHRQWGRDFAADRGQLHAWRLRDGGADRRLRIAYLGVDAHTALQRFVPVLARQHDPALVDVLFVYRCADSEEVAAAARALPQVQHLHASGSDDRALARTLAMCEIDIAVDLCGHGVGHVLGALTFRPAPVQLTWLDYLATTGVAAIDYRIADAVSDPDDADWPVLSSESVLRLPFAQWCWLPPEGQTVAAQVADATVFGIVNVASKLSNALLARAASLLEALPEARLRLIGIAGEGARRRVLDALPAHLHARVELLGRVSAEEFQQLLAGIDIALDPLVFSGATSTLDCLWAGVPVITEPGLLPHTRSSASILHTLQLNEWIAADAEEFVQIGIALAANPLRRAPSWRMALRERLRQSSLCDGRRFVAALEALYRQLWQRHLDQAGELERTVHGSDLAALRRLLVTRANAALQAGEPGAAVQALEVLALAMPNEAVQRNLSRAWNNLGVLRQREGRHQDALTAFRCALVVWSQNPEAIANLADPTG